MVLTLFLKGDPGRLVPLGIALCVDVQDDTHAHGANKIDCNTLLQTDAIAAATTANRGNKRQVLFADTRLSQKWHQAISFVHKLTNRTGYLQIFMGTVALSAMTLH